MVENNKGRIVSNATDVATPTIRKVNFNVFASDKRGSPKDELNDEISDWFSSVDKFKITYCSQDSKMRLNLDSLNSFILEKKNNNSYHCLFIREGFKIIQCELLIQKLDHLKINLQEQATYIKKEQRLEDKKDSLKSPVSTRVAVESSRKNYCKLKEKFRTGKDIFETFRDNFCEKYIATLNFVINCKKKEFASFEFEYNLLRDIQKLLERTKKIFEFYEKLEERVKKNIKKKPSTPSFHRLAKTNSNSRRIRGAIKFVPLPSENYNSWGEEEEIKFASVTPRMYDFKRSRRSSGTNASTLLVCGKEEVTPNPNKNNEEKKGVVSKGNEGVDNKTSRLKIFFISLIGLAFFLSSSCISYFAIKFINYRLSKRKYRLSKRKMKK